MPVPARLLCAIGILFVAPAQASAQAPQVAFATRFCSGWVTASAPPDTQTGWGIQFRRHHPDGSITNISSRDTSPPYQRDPGSLAPGSHVFSGVWTRTGSPSVATPQVTFTCPSGSPPPQTEPVDCVVSDWTFQSATAWGECSAGTQTRTETWVRTVVTPPSGGGTACPALTEPRTATQACSVTACAFSVAPTSAQVSSAGGVGSVTVTASPEGCSPATWTASSAATWVTAPVGGTGSGSASYTVAANGGPERTGTLTIAGQAFTVTQAAALNGSGLCVNDANGDDALTAAQVRAGTGCWKTIGRAAWGSTNRVAPNPTEAAQPGDTVRVAAGTYVTTVAVNNRWGVVYNPANSGTASGWITFLCEGTCVLGAPNANAPVIGGVSRSYIAWRGGFNLTAYGLQAGTAQPTQVNTAPDTGPAVCQGSDHVVFDGVIIDGGQQVDYTDNYPAVRAENCPDGAVTNSTLRNFRNQNDTFNGTLIQMYGSPRFLVENNVGENAGSFASLKDQSFTFPQNGIRIRYNRITGVNGCFAYSVTGEDRNFIYQNVCTDSGFALFVTGGGLWNDWIVNNTFVGMRNAGVYPTSLGSGGRFWNNILVSADTAILLEASPMVSQAAIDIEHNCYFGHRRFYAGTDGVLSFPDFNARYPQHNADAPRSLEVDPQFVNQAGGDYRLATTSPVRQLAVDIMDLNGDGSSTDLIPAGAYITGAEIIGRRN